MMADDTVADALPPQATGDSVPGQAAAAGSSAQDTIEQSLYGDGAQGVLQTLRNAAPPVRPTAPPAGPGPAPAGNTPVAAALPPAMPPVGAGPIGTGGQMIMGALSGNPLAGMQANMSIQQVLMQRQMMQAGMAQRAQTMAVNDFTFLDKLKTIPIQNRAALVQQYFAEQGRHVPPAMAAVLSSQEVLTKMTAPEIGARLQTDPQFAQTFWYSMDKPKEFLTLHDDVQKQHADTTRAMNEAEASKYAPEKARLGVAQAGAELTKIRRDLSTMPSLTDEQLAGMSAAGRAFQVDPKSGQVNVVPANTPGAVPAADIIKEKRQNEVASTAAVTTAKMKAGPVPPEVAAKLTDLDTTDRLLMRLAHLYDDKRRTGVPAERKAWGNRVRQVLDYDWGLQMPQNLDEDTALRSLTAVMAGRSLILGRPNQRLMGEVWKHTGQNPLISPEQMKNRIGIMRMALGSQKQGLVHYTGMTREELGGEGPEATTTGAPNWRDIANAYPGSNAQPTGQPAP